MVGMRGREEGGGMGAGYAGRMKEGVGRGNGRGREENGGERGKRRWS